MWGTNKMVIWVMTGLMAVTTMFFNLYIFLMSLWNYKQKKQWSPSETIITALSVANVAHQLICYFWMTMDEVDIDCNLPHMPYSVMLVFIQSFKFTVMWTSGFLTFYYSTKLVTTPNQCYTKIQAAILKHVTLVVVLIPLCGLATCLPMLVVLHAENITTVNQDCGVMMPDTITGKVYEILYLMLADVVPGLLMIKCCISISAYLAIHLRKMKASTNGAHGPKLGAQMRVIRMALSLVAAFLCFLVVDLYVHCKIAIYHENTIVLAFLFTSVYTTVSAMVLIYGKKTFWKALIQAYNICLDEYPCLSCLKVPGKKAKPSSRPTIKN